MEGIRYYDDKPESCRCCFFWKNRKAGCILEERNCYYLAESVKSEQEKKCEGCCYAKTQPCVSACCYKELDRWLLASREMRGEKGGAQMLMYGKEASNRKQEIDRQHYTIPNQRPKDKHCGKI